MPKGYDPEKYDLESVDASQGGGIIWNLIDKKTGKLVRQREGQILSGPTGMSPRQVLSLKEDQLDKEVQKLEREQAEYYRSLRDISDQDINAVQSMSGARPSPAELRKMRDAGYMPESGATPTPSPWPIIEVK